MYEIIVLQITNKTFSMSQPCPMLFFNHAVNGDIPSKVQVGLYKSLHKEINIYDEDIRWIGKTPYASLV